MIHAYNSTSTPRTYLTVLGKVSATSGPLMEHKVWSGLSSLCFQRWQGTDASDPEWYCGNDTANCQQWNSHKSVDVCAFEQHGTGFCVAHLNSNQSHLFAESQDGLNTFKCCGLGVTVIQSCFSWQVCQSLPLWPLRHPGRKQFHRRDVGLELTKGQKIYSILHSNKCISLRFPSGYPMIEQFTKSKV